MTTTAIGGHADRSPARVLGTRSAASAGTAMRVLARRVHFLAGVVVAPFLVLLCLTGLAYVFSPQIHSDLYHSQLYVRQVTGSPHPVSEQVASALRAHPEGTLRSVIPPPAPDRTTRVALAVPGLDGVNPNEGGQPVRSRTVFVDPYTNYINGELTTLDNQLPANTWLRVLHSNLHLGDGGRVYSELAASWLPFIVLGGIVLWFAGPGRRRRLGELLVPAVRGRAPWVRLRAVKGPLGLWLALGLLVVGITGLSMSHFAGGRADQAVNPLDAHRPALTAAPVAVPEHAHGINLDTAIAVARADGLDGELVVTMPATDDAPFTVIERGQGLPVERDALAIDPYTGEVTERLDWSAWPFLAKVATLGAEFHTGTLFGIANQVLMALLAIGIIVLIVLSYAMWWKRSPYGGRWAALPPPAWRQLPRTVLVAVVVAAALLGWLLPVFGMSLVGFVVVDAVLNVIRAKRRSVAALVAGGARRIGARPVVAGASAALIAASVLAVLLLWPFGSQQVGGALPAPMRRSPSASAPTGEPTPTVTGTAPPRTRGPAREPSGAKPASDSAPTSGHGGAPRDSEPGQEPGPAPTGQPTTSPSPRPTVPPAPSPSPSPSPSPPPGPPQTPAPSPPPPGDGTPCLIRIGDLCVVVDLGWL